MSKKKTTVNANQNNFGKYGYWRMTVVVHDERVIEFLTDKKRDGGNFSRVVNSILKEYIKSTAVEE